MGEDNKKCCGKCKWNGYDRDQECFFCDCSESVYYGAMTAYDDICSDFEGREEGFILYE